MKELRFNRSNVKENLPSEKQCVYKTPIAKTPHNHDND